MWAQLGRLYDYKGKMDGRRENLKFEVVYDL